MFEPATFATPEERIAAEVGMVEIELRRIEQRLAALNWETASARPPAGESWADFCFGLPRERDYSDVPRRVLVNKRKALALELERWRATVLRSSKR